MYDYSYDYAHCREIFFSFKKILISYFLDVENDT